MKEWDAWTIRNEPISPGGLMERAATQCVQWILAKPWKDRTFHIFCGKGNNGGDGQVIARLLKEKGYRIYTYMLGSGQDRPVIAPGDIIVDALFGTGLSRPLDGPAAGLVRYINEQHATVLSIDLPSGLSAEGSAGGHPVIKANVTLTFQTYKASLLLADNAPFTGSVVVLDIGLDAAFLDGRSFPRRMIDEALIGQIFHPRSPFAHKGNFGHALLVAGSYGKMGAAVLCARACLHAGVGLLTCFLPASGYSIMQTAVPEAMVLTDADEHHLTQLPEGIEKYSAVGIGPGIGTDEATQKMISFVARRYNRPLVIDADALNCLSRQPELLHHLPAHTILTPHPKEFDRLFGEHQTDADRMTTAEQKARELQLTIVLKGHHTQVATAEGLSFFNTTGNAGMAKGGSGDVLTGIITALAAGPYSPSDAAVLGVYLHGLAGDLAAAATSEESMTPSDLVEHLGNAFSKIHLNPYLCHPAKSGI